MERFPTKIDWWLAAIIIAVTLVATGAAVAATLGAGASGLPAFITPVFMVALFRVVGWPINYDVGAEELVVRFGPFKKRIRLAEIRRVTPSHNPLSSPALSLDRIRIDYGRGSFVLVSPRDRGGFARAIQSRVPAAEVDPGLLATPPRTTR